MELMARQGCILRHQLEDTFLHPLIRIIVLLLMIDSVAEKWFEFRIK